MKKLYLLSTILFFVFTLSANEGLSHTVNSQLLVLDRDIVGNEIVDWCESNGGYYVQRSSDLILLRIPNDKLTEMRPFLESISEELINYTQQSENLLPYISEYKSGIEAREDILEQNLYYISTSDVEGTLTLEQEIRRLREEIDTYKGSLRRMENDIQMATVILNISFKSRSLNRNIYSNFNWINNVDFYYLMGNDMLAISGGFSGPRTQLPAGFALIDNRPNYLAISPEGVRLQVRRFDNYPEQELDFWKNALLNHLEKIGYIKIDDFSTYENENEEPFVVMKWGVPYGNQDYIYMTGIRIVRGKIEIIEIAGEAEYFNYYF